MANSHPTICPDLMPTALKPPEGASLRRLRAKTHGALRTAATQAERPKHSRGAARLPSLLRAGSRCSFPLLPTLLRRRITDDKLQNQSKEAMAC